MSKPYAKHKIVAEMIETIRKEVHYFSLISWVNSNTTYMYRILLMCIEYYSYV